MAFHRAKSRRAKASSGADAVIHLAGEPVAQRWTPEAKKRIRASRVDGTRHLVNALSTESHRPNVLICASAIGIYGSRGDEVLTESSRPGDDFLSRVVIDWEKSAALAEALGIRVVRISVSAWCSAKTAALWQKCFRRSGLAWEGGSATAVNGCPGSILTTL